MDSLRPGRAAATYAISGAVCLAAPYILPPSAENAFVWPNFLFAGVPLCLSGLLLATVHAQHRLDKTRDRATALAWAFGAFFLALPVPFWGAAVGQYNLVLWIQATAVALAAVFLVALAGRFWAQRSRMRLFLSAGTAALALLFARVTYGIVSGMFVEYTGGLEGIAEDAATFLWAIAIACAALVIGVLGHQFTATRQGTATAG
jgi:hypothetical protein